MLDHGYLLVVRLFMFGIGSFGVCIRYSCAGGIAFGRVLYARCSSCAYARSSGRRFRSGFGVGIVELPQGKGWDMQRVLCFKANTCLAQICSQCISSNGVTA